MNDSGGHYPFIGNDPKRVDRATGELFDLGVKVLDLAGDVHRDAVSIQEAWPKGHTGQLAKQDVARMGKSLNECHEAFMKAAQALDRLLPALGTGRTKVHHLNDCYQTLSAALSA